MYEYSYIYIQYHESHIDVYMYKYKYSSGCTYFYCSGHVCICNLVIMNEQHRI